MKEYRIFKVELFKFLIWDEDKCFYCHECEDFCLNIYFENGFNLDIDCEGCMECECKDDALEWIQSDEVIIK